MNVAFQMPARPAPTTPLEHAADAIGWDSRSLRDLLELARWDEARQLAEFAQPDWLERLRADSIKVFVTRRLRPIGPAGARELTSRELRAKVTAPALLTAAATYTGYSALLLGKTGVGKTLTGMLMSRKFVTDLETSRLSAVRDEDLYNELTYRGDAAQVAWVSCSELPRLVANQPFGREPEIVERAKRAPLAVLDDLTWGANDKALLEIIACRYDRGLPTVSTAGVQRTELVARLGDAAVRRLLECRGEKGVVVEAF